MDWKLGLHSTQCSEALVPADLSLQRTERTCWKFGVAGERRNTNSKIRNPSSSNLCKKWPERDNSTMVSLWPRAEYNTNHQTLVTCAMHQQCTGDQLWKLLERYTMIWLWADLIGIQWWQLDVKTLCWWCTCMCAFFLTQPFPCLDHFSNWALQCQLVPRSFPPSPGTQTNLLTLSTLLTQ